VTRPLVPVAELVLYLEGRAKPARFALDSAARANIIDSWRNGRPVYAARVTAPDGREIAPADVLWPDRRGGRRPGAGRPKSGAEARTDTRQVRLSPTESARYDAAAERAGVAFADWARSAMEAAAKGGRMMGLDISVHVEARRDGAWQYLGNDSDSRDALGIVLTRPYPDGSPQSVYPFTGHDRAMMHAIGDLDGCHITPFGHRGVPSDASSRTRDQAARSYSFADSHSWATAAEMLAVDWESIGLGDNGFVPALAAVCAHHGLDPADVRAVYWFDA